MSGNITLDWAAYYAGQGLRVFPIKPGQKSPPLITDWPKLATSDVVTVSAWWALWAQANIGVVMGAGLVDIETDVKPDANGEESLAKWAASSRITLPPTWSFKSGSGGIHRIFRCEGDMPNRVGILPAVDIRGGSGYAVFPPSLHPSGKYYEWLPGCSPADLPGGPAPVPPELFFLLRDDSKTPLDVPAEVIEGSRNDTLFRLALLMALCVAAGEDFLGRHTKMPSALYGAGEQRAPLAGPPKGPGYRTHTGKPLPANGRTADGRWI